MEALFVGTLDGLFKVVPTKDAWKVAAKDLSGAEVNCLVVRPDRRNVLYAGVRGGGLYRSEDNGKSWNRLGEGVLSDKIRAVALDPSNPKVIYVGTEPPSLWRSEDEGKSWKELTGVKKLADERKWTYPVPVIQPHIRSIAVDPRNSRRLCIAAQVGGVLLSEDEGTTWRDVRYPIDLDVHSVTFDFGRPNILYAATGGGENFPDPTPPPKGRPLYRSTDSGQSWESISATFHRTYSVPVRVHPADSRTLYIGVAEEPPPLWLKRPTKANGAIMRSSDGGTNWEQLTHGLPNPFESMVECIEFDPDQPDHVLIGTGGEGARFIKLTEGEVFHSRDRGDHWENTQLRLPIIYALAVQ
jgi:Sortilin, neurotensin receptor 3,